MKNMNPETIEIIASLPKTVREQMHHCPKGKYVLHTKDSLVFVDPIDERWFTELFKYEDAFHRTIYEIIVAHNDADEGLIIYEHVKVFYNDWTDEVKVARQRVIR